ncbi:MAG: hypothetical protein ACTHMG_03775 [Sphingomonas sp.]
MPRKFRPARTKRATRIVGAIIVILLLIWLMTVLGFGISSHKNLKNNPEPGQQAPAPAANAAF